MKLLLFCLAGCLQAQTTLSGIVQAKDRSVVLPGSHITISGNGIEKSATANPAGQFEFTSLPAGQSLHIHIEAAGFASLDQDLTLDSPQQLTFQLTLADSKQSIVVEGGFLSVRSDAPEHSNTINSTQLREIPSNGRRLMRFALLDPHVRQAIGLGSDGNDSYRLSINGNSYRHTGYVLDGIVNYDWYLAVAPQQAVSVGAVDQLKVVSGQYAADFGFSTAGILVVNTKSGTNDFHGEGIGFIRPSGIQAQAPLASASLPHIPNERTQWGASLGGPLTRDRAYFFLNYEGANQHRGAFIQSPNPGFFLGTTNDQFALAKIDYRFSEKHWLTWRSNGALFNGDNVNDFVSGFSQPNAGREARLQSWGNQVTLHSVAGPLFNQLRASYTSYFPNSAFPLISGVGISRPSYSTEGNSANSWAHVRNTNITNTTAFRIGSHQFKFGGDYLRQIVKDYAYTPLGTYTFAAGPPTPNQAPLRFAQTFGVANFKYGQSVYSLFLQDDWRLNSQLSLNLGLRYENQSVTNDRNNFAPRLGLAWDIRGNGKTMLRAGAGMFYDQFYLYVYRRFFSLGPDSPTASYTIPFGDPAFPSFPNSLTAPPTGISSGRKDLYLKPSQILNPYSLQYTLALEQRLPKNVTLTIDGLHSHVLRQYRVNDINHPAPFLRTGPGQVRTAAQADLTRPYTTYLGVPVRLIAVIENSASSIYDSLTLGVTKRSGKRLQFGAHYAISSSATYTMFHGDANGGVPNEWDNWGSAERAPSDFYQRHRFTMNGTADLTRGFRFSLYGVAASGLPVNPLTGTDNNGDTYSADRPVGFGRNSFRTSAQVQFDASLQKTIRLTERLSFDVRAECFNLFNRSNYINVNNVYGDTGTPRATFLQPIAGVTNTDPSRQLQLGMRIWF